MNYMTLRENSLDVCKDFPKQKCIYIGTNNRGINREYNRRELLWQNLLNWGWS